MSKIGIRMTTKIIIKKRVVVVKSNTNFSVKRTLEELEPLF